MDDPLDAYQATYQEQRTQSFDRQATSALVKALKMPPAARNHLYATAEQYRRSRPQISDFRAAFPDFPVHFVVDRQDNLRDTAGLSTLFPAAKLSKQPFIVDYFASRDDLMRQSAGRPVGILMKWPRIPTAVVLHQIPVSEDIPGVRLRLIKKIDGRMERLTLEPVEQLQPLLAEWLAELW